MFLRLLTVVPCLFLWHVGIAQGEALATRPAATAPSAFADGDFTIGPKYTDAPELMPQPGVPIGQLHDFVMDSQDSRIYPGIRGPYQRKVCVYIPAQYVPGTSAPFIIVQDGLSYRKTLPAVLDNLIAAGRVPVQIAIMINSGGGDAQGSERGLEYDTVSDRYSNFIEDEVLPRVEKDLSVKFTDDPEGRATMGGSSGGAAAFTMAWFHPERYRRVLTYSGTYVNQQSPLNPQSPHGAWEYHEHLIAGSNPKPLRVWLEVGENDNGSKKPESSLHNWPLANQRMAAALKAKGYHYRFDFALAAGHVDRKVVRQTLPEALEWLWAGYASR
jgi:enterochelin esterase-like enzyme